MRRMLSALALLLLVTGGAYAQSNSIGFKAGVNFSEFGGADVESMDALTSVVGGGFAVFRLANTLSVQPEVSYMQKGAKQDIGSTSVKFRLGYIEVPVLLRFAPEVTAGSILPHIVAGPTIAFKTSCKVKGEAGSVSVDVDCDDPEFDLPVKATDFGLTAGGGVDVPVGRAFITLDARYGFSLATIDDSSPADDVKNRGFTVMAGFRFPLGGATELAAR